MSTTTPPRSAQVRLQITEPYCPSCLPGIEASLRRLNGVRATTVHTTTGGIEVTYDPCSVDLEDLLVTVGGAGYLTVPAPDDPLPGDERP
ncbi:heavy metal-associated domain-containing protein [Georgenia subflava]|uniref:Heavy metal transport/detoxification protein n=1 Tax=Georgenia subflava TaxID=1622177 RepID=A0A6N7EH54_9MICO|nr:heavy metal-associated domain-containing protein [Georgenia subflava]MPV35985.1 heavy metal transport/detoxification protein [Georgenia subflava]